MDVSTAPDGPAPTAPEALSARAVWFARAGQVELRQEELPPVGPEQVRVHAAASGLSLGTEMLVFRGQVSPDLDLDLPTLRGSFSFPIKYGYAGTGRIVERGRDVGHLQVGDAVFVHHPHQTDYVVPASMPVPLPADLPLEEGVLFANVETALNVLLDAHPRLGERIAIFGQGVVGLLITQLARRAGAGTIIAVDPIARRRELALLLGADAAVAPDDDLPDTVRGLTAGAGADIAIEASGNPSALAVAIDCVAREGTVVVCSWYGTKPVSVPLGGAFHRGRVRLVSSQVGSLNPALGARWSHARRTELAMGMLPSLQLSPLISHRIPFERAAEAYALIDSTPQEAVQVILTYGEGDV